MELKDSYGEIGLMIRRTSLGPNWANVANTLLRYFKNYSYQDGISVPLIFVWPNGLHNPDCLSDFTGHFIDTMVTFVICGTPYPEEYKGHRVYPAKVFRCFQSSSTKKPSEKRPFSGNGKTGKPFVMVNGNW